MRRRAIIAGLGALASRQATGRALPWENPDLPLGVQQSAHMVMAEGKQPLIELSDRPLNLETPVQALRSAVTPNDQFFVRYHAGGPPKPGALDKWALEIKGDAAGRHLRLSERDLFEMPQGEVVAVCQCAGLRRGFIQPHVPGVQWGHGGMGCATWHGPRLRDVLATAEIAPDATEIWLEGLEGSAPPGVPKYRKSIPMTKAMADETIVATSMNGAPLPILNGFPARLVVAGWASTYWVKHLSGITVSTKPLDEFWMSQTYRIPRGLTGRGTPFDTQESETTWPVTELPVNSLIADPADGDEVERSGFKVRGVAWDKGSGILRVDVSLDGGQSWLSAFLDREISPFAYRTFSLETGPLPRGRAELRVRAVSNTKEAQPNVWSASAGGYHNNVPQRVFVTVV